MSVADMSVADMIVVDDGKNALINENPGGGSNAKKITR
jgi:hypothetical protein